MFAENRAGLETAMYTDKIERNRVARADARSNHEGGGSLVSPRLFQMSNEHRIYFSPSVFSTETPPVRAEARRMPAARRRCRIGKRYVFGGDSR